MIKHKKEPQGEILGFLADAIFIRLIVIDEYYPRVTAGTVIYGFFRYVISTVKIRNSKKPSKMRRVVF